MCSIVLVIKFVTFCKTIGAAMLPKAVNKTQIKAQIKANLCNEI